MVSSNVPARASVSSALSLNTGWVSGHQNRRRQGTEEEIRGRGGSVHWIQLDQHVTPTNVPLGSFPPH